VYRGESRSRILPIILILIVVAIGIAALVSVGRAIFGGVDQPIGQPDTSRQALLDTAVDRSVRMTVRGKIVADEDFRSYRITVSPTSRTLTTYGGYIEQVIDTKQLGNNSQAYEEFVYALDRTNFVTASALTGDKDDTRGVCASGKVYEFEVVQGDAVVKRLWTSTCKAAPGSLKVNSTPLSELFLGQIPGNRELLKKISL
jgi:hypothetical protein